MVARKIKEKKTKIPPRFWTVESSGGPGGKEHGKYQGRNYSYTGQLQIILSPYAAPFLSLHDTGTHWLARWCHPSYVPTSSIQPEQGKHISWGYSGQHARLQCCRQKGRDTSLDAILGAAPAWLEHVALLREELLKNWVMGLASGKEGIRHASDV